MTSAFAEATGQEREAWQSQADFTRHCEVASADPRAFAVSECMKAIEARLAADGPGGAA